MKLSGISDNELKAELYRREKLQQDKQLAAKRDLIDFIKRSRTINDCLKESFFVNEIVNIDAYYKNGYIKNNSVIIDIEFK